jgi:hypothetical protein
MLVCILLQRLHHENNAAVTATVREFPLNVGTPSQNNCRDYCQDSDQYLLSARCHDLFVGDFVRGVNGQQ